jgi:hypothetical protein
LLFEQKIRYIPERKIAVYPISIGSGDPRRPRQAKPESGVAHGINTDLPTGPAFFCQSWKCHEDRKDFHSNSESDARFAVCQTKFEGGTSYQRFNPRNFLQSLDRRSQMSSGSMPQKKSLSKAVSPTATCEGSIPMQKFWFLI